MIPQRIAFAQENGVAVATMAVAGFAIMYLADPGDLDDPVLRREFLENIRTLRTMVPRERAFLVLEALAELHPEGSELKTVIEQMRRTR